LRERIRDPRGAAAKLADFRPDFRKKGHQPPKL